MKRDGRSLAHNTLEEMRILAVQRMAVSVPGPSNLPESTGGEAWGCRDSREGGFQVSVVLRAPFYAGTKSSGLHAGDT